MSDGALGAESERTGQHLLKRGETFAIFDRSGDIVPGESRPDGLWHESTRFLSRACLLLDGMAPLFLSSTVARDNAVMRVDLAHPEPDRELVVADERIHLQLSAFLVEGCCYKRVQLTNYSDRPVDVSLTYQFESDFADIFEVRGVTRNERGRHAAPAVGEAEVRLSYEGLDGRHRSTCLRFSPRPDELRADQAGFELCLSSGEPVTVDIAISCAPDAEAHGEVMPFDDALAAARQAARDRSAEVTAIETSHEQFNEWLQRSLSDLAMMETSTPHGRYVYAGIPWFSAPFGRDGLITALEMLWVNPAVAAGVLRFLAAEQADAESPEHDAEPGKILHESRRGELAATGEIPFGRYYGSVDATPLFIMLAGEYYTATGDIALVRDIWPNIRRALQWIDEYGDIDGDGFVEYERHSENGLVHQGWKDSAAPIYHRDGSTPAPRIALCEVQGYVYAALRHASHLARLLDDPSLADRLTQRAERLRRKFDEAFWCEELNTYAVALDGLKQQCRLRTSNAGQVLMTGIAKRERARPLVRTLLDPTSFSGWGVRTLAAEEPGYNPMSYHNGSVWPHDNALVAAGMARYGYKREALRVLTGLFEASLFVELHRLPELFCGFDRREEEGPSLYPVACRPQSWAAAAPLLLLQACLGLRIDAPRGRLILDRPELPASLTYVFIRNLQVGEASLDLALRRHQANVGVTVERRQGDVEVMVTK